MKLRTFYALCCLCLSCTVAADDEEDQGENRSILDPSELLQSEKLRIYLDEGNPRDKRALGLILSGLAQVFGYDVSPIQVASLPNVDPSNPPPNEGVLALSANQTASMNSTMSSTTPAPRQRETIRFTGVLNFGSNGSLLTQLQEYEQVFHGNSTSGSMMNGTTPAPATPKMPDARQPVAPLLVNIPLPVIPQPALPEIPPQDIKLTYPEPIRYISVTRQQEMVTRKNESSVKPTSQPVQSGQNVKSPPLQINYHSANEPPWKKEYDERLTELERKQAEHAEILRLQEEYRNRLRDYGYDKEDDRELNQEKGNRGEDSKCNGKEKDNYDNYSSVEEEDSREGYQNQGRVPSEGSKELQDNSQEDYETDQRPNKQQEEGPINDNYSNVPINEPLPISGDDEHQWPQQLRNSYGELLNSSELEDGLANFFGQFKQASGFKMSDSGGNLNDEDSSRSIEEEDGSNENEREEHNPPARNKYEEYSLEDDTDTKRKEDEKNAEENTSNQPSKLFDKSNRRNESQLDEKISEEVDFTNFTPLIVPARYVSAPEETKKAKSRFSAIEKLNRINKVPSRDANKKVPSKTSRRPKKENLKPKATIPERNLPKKLHEGEQKNLQVWPPPFDFVLDGTIQPDDVSGRPSRRYVKAPNAVGKDETQVQRTNVRKTESRMTNNNQRNRGHLTSPEDSSRERLKNGSKFGRVSTRQSTELMNRDNRTRSASTSAKPPQQHYHRGTEATDYWDRYKYATNDNYRTTNRPNIEIIHPAQRQTSRMQPKRFENLKRSTEKSVTGIESYYTDRSPVDTTKKPDVKNQNIGEFQVMVPQFAPPGPFIEPVPAYFHVPPMNYQFDQKVDNEKEIDVSVPRQNAYRHDDSLTKFTSEPENANGKVRVGSYVGVAPDVGISAQKTMELNRPTGYVDYVHIL
ncbi:uncharacterized protein LOC116426373 [Nomia melanderi]|uniref:uncharacterized protein LOC116426373 n=1 Tax=Nomia melanderi TaxID=2448451 RepID=UPI003FCE81FA